MIQEELFTVRISLDTDERVDRSLVEKYLIARLEGDTLEDGLNTVIDEVVVS